MSRDRFFAGMGISIATLSLLPGCGIQGTSQPQAHVPTAKQLLIVSPNLKPTNQIVSANAFISEVMNTLPKNLLVSLMAPTEVPKTRTGMVLSARTITIFNQSGYVVQFYQGKQYPINQVNTASAAKMITTFEGWPETANNQLQTASGYNNLERPVGYGPRTFKTGTVQLSDSLHGTYYSWKINQSPGMTASYEYYGINTSYRSWTIQVVSNNLMSPVNYANQIIQYVHQHGLPQPHDKGLIVMNIEHPAYKPSHVSTYTVVTWTSGKFLYNTTFGTQVPNPNPWYFGIELAASMHDFRSAT